MKKSFNEGLWQRLYLPLIIDKCNSLKEELEVGIVKESTLTELVDIINRMKEEDGIEGIILGCTELPLILNSDNCPVRCFDAVDIHLKKLISLTMA